MSRFRDMRLLAIAGVFLGTIIGFALTAQAILG